MSATPLQDITVTYPATRIRTRGYHADIPGIKRSVEARAVVATWNPIYEVAAYTDGQAEHTAIRTITKDRTRFTRPFDRPSFEVVNLDDTAMDPYREDYSLLMPEDEGVNLGSGVLLDAHQVTSETMALKARGNWFTMEFNVSQGRIVLQSVELSALIDVDPRQKATH